MKKIVEYNPGVTAITYYRYSSAAQRDVSIDQQRQEAETLAEKRGLKIVKEYLDRAITGTRDDRPGLLQMLSEIERIRPAYLILWKTDRLSRDKYDSVIFKKRIRDAGVRIIYVAEPTPEDEGEQILLEGIFEALAASFIYTHRKNVCRGLEDNARKALYNGQRTFGYVGKPNCKFEVDPDKAAIVQVIFQRYADGVSIKKIVDELNSKGIKTLRNTDFTPNSVRYILMNRSYIGEYSWGDVVIKDGMPRLVSDELFEKAQNRLDSNKYSSRRKKSKEFVTAPKFDLTGKLICGKCGGTLGGTSGTSRHGYKCYYYTCINHKKGGCNLKSIRKNDIEKIVENCIDSIIKDPTLRIIIGNDVYRYYMSIYGDSGLEDSLKAELRDTEKKIENMIKAIEEGVVTKTTMSRLQELEAQQELIVEELAAEDIRKKYQLKASDVVRYLESFLSDTSDNVDSKKNIYESLINKIVVFDDKFVISFNYSDDVREISLEDCKKILENSEDILGRYDLNNVDGLNEKMLDSMMYPEKYENQNFF